MESVKVAKPFLKWVGGKTQLIPEIESRMAKKLADEEFIYVEPFVGSGAVLFWILGKYPNIQKAVINDINQDLINTYKVIKKSSEPLIELLTAMQNEYYSFLDNDDKKKEYFYSQRDKYNSRKSDEILQAALFIFLNRTCFNGLYRVNKKNEFNVPMGSYKKPKISDPENLRLASSFLQKVEILQGDFEQTFSYAGSKSFFYLDPPYKPLSLTSSFTSYANQAFDDDEQIRLAKFCEKLTKNESIWLLSNSDVNSDSVPNDFFDNLYRDYEIKRVLATRRINSNAKKRGSLKELLISNY